MEPNRRLVFISHDNPKDNDATLWLASKLTCEGYQVWSDITQLFGGELFWDDIEEAIRSHTVKFLTLVSRNSQDSQGFLDELNLATLVEREHRFNQFVIPIRLDDLPFSEFKVNITRKNAVDFSNNWAEGLLKLLERFDRDKVPKSTNIGPNSISEWFRGNQRTSAKVLNSPQLLTSNWIPIIEIPKFLHFSRTPTSGLGAHDLVKLFSHPSLSYQQYICSFATNDELQPDLSKWLVLTKGHTIMTEDLINGSVSNTLNIIWQDGQNMASNLFRKSWDMEMHNRGLQPYILSDYATAWYLPKNLIDKDNSEYRDMDGKVKSRLLVGRSNKFNVFWHFAASIHPLFYPYKRFALRTHVVFTDDGVIPIDSKTRMHRLRRSFCRSWWNERWRGLIYAYLSFLAKGQVNICLNVSPSNNILLNNIPFDFKSPLTLDESQIPYEEIPDDLIDFYDDDYDIYSSEETEEDVGIITSSGEG